MTTDIFTWALTDIFAWSKHDNYPPAARASGRARETDCIAIVEFGDGTALDASRAGTDFRYVNHSCEPNTFMRLYKGRVEFYTLRRVEAGEELTCDYGETHHDG